MDDMMESVKRLTGKAEKENEVERLKKKFNFVSSGSPASFLPNSAKNPPVKVTIANSMNKLTTINSAKGKRNAPVKVTYPKARERSSSGVKFSSNRPVNISSVVNIVNNNNINNAIPKGTTKPVKLTRDTIGKSEVKDGSGKRSQSSVKSSNRHGTNKHVLNSEDNSSIKSDADATERRGTNNSQIGLNFMDRDSFLREVVNNISKNDSFDCKAYYLTDTSAIKHIEATKLSQPCFNEGILQNSNNLHVSNFPDEQMINNYGASYLENKKDYSSFFSKQKVFELEDERADQSNSSSLLHHFNPDVYSQSKRNNIFVNNPSYNLSSRLLNDESRHHHSVTKNSDYKFIEKIREEKSKLPTVKAKRFWGLSDEAMYVFISFVSDQYNDIIKANTSLANKVCLTLNNMWETTIKTFCTNYKSMIELQEFYFKQTDLNPKKGKNKMAVIDLVLKSKIVTKEVNRCLEISLVFKVRGKEYLQTWRLDIKRKKDIGFWFASEAEEFNRSIVRHCYFQPIISFCQDDFVEFRVNIFSKEGPVDPFSVRWLDLVVYSTPEHSFFDYEKSLLKSNVKFDSVRFCELENVIHVWKGESTLTKKENIEEFKRHFMSNFKILSVNYDFSKFYIFKVKMKAAAVGLVKRNKFTNVEIEVKAFEDTLTNETQCLGLLNINHLAKRVQIRVSSYMIFYFTDIYL